MRAGQAQRWALVIRAPSASEASLWCCGERGEAAVGSGDQAIPAGDARELNEGVSQLPADAQSEAAVALLPWSGRPGTFGPLPPSPGNTYCIY